MIEKKLELLKSFVNNNDKIRAMVLQGSYVNDAIELDVFSDLDPKLYVTDIDAFIKDESWIAFFGRPISRFSDTFTNTDGTLSYTRLMIMEDGFKFDFGFAHIDQAPYANEMELYKIIIDKDNIIPLPEVTDERKFYVEKPTETTYKSVLDDFFFDTSYVIKSLYREEMVFTKYMFQILQKKIRALLSWYIGYQHDFKVNTGIIGRYMKKYLTTKEWDMLLNTYSGKDIKDNLNALYASFELVRYLGIKIADKLDFNYPMKQDEDMLAYVKNKEKLFK